MRQAYVNVKPIKAILTEVDYVTQIKKLLAVKSNAIV